MNLVILRRARKQLEKLPKIKQIIVGQKVRSLALESEISNLESLSGHKNYYRARVGDYRIIFRREEGEVMVVVIGHRKEVYRLFEQLLK